MEFKVENVRKILPFIIIGVVALVVSALIFSKPKAQKSRASEGPKISIKVVDVQSSAFTPKILSYGLVEPLTRTRLVAQVSGRVESVSERFRDGSFFRKGELLLQLESTDHEIEVKIAEANLVQAEQALEEEIALVEQAKADWGRLGSDSPASPLVLRKPQLNSAQATVESAKALLKQAQVNLERAFIRAPYDGRVLTTDIDLGQVASENTVLGEIYAVDAVEVRLPIKNDDLSFLNLPESYRHQDLPKDSFPEVSIRSELAKEEVWFGRIVRTAGSIDDTNRQLNVVARIDDPFGTKAQGRFPLKIGQYVSAEIDGMTFDSVVTIPNKAVYQGSYVYLHKEGAVYRTPIDIKWQNGEVAIVSSGVSSGDQLVVSPLGQVNSGTLVKLAPQLTESATSNEPNSPASGEADIEKTGEVE